MCVGTGSHAGKSVLAAALCRIFARRGYRVAPFKAQNMALNSFVTPEGGELGRAQAYQARAAGVEPHVDMNPVLLKPSSQTGSQVIVLGRPVRHMAVREYHAYQPEVWPVVTAAYDRLRAANDLIVIEGAGSPAEINLRDQDIVNMRMALYAQAPTLLIGDIDRGGVFASLVGHMELFTPEERELIAAFVINKFRGDATLLDSGIEFLQEKTGVPTLGVVPMLTDWRGDEEDSLGIEDRRRRAKPHAPLQIAVVRLPFISNYTDFDVLADEPDVNVRYVTSPAELEGAAAVVLPGTKSTVADLAWLRESGVAAAFVRSAAAIPLARSHSRSAIVLLVPGSAITALPSSSLGEVTYRTLTSGSSARASKSV
jgi:adenosylcobyric acid synthase